MKKPIYSAIEILEFINRLDLDELAILGELIGDDMGKYSITAVSIIHANFSRRVQVLAKGAAAEAMAHLWQYKDTHQ